MRRTFERCTKARLSFSGGQHAPANKADNMENAGSWTVCGSKEEVQKNFKDLRKLVRNILSAIFTGACGAPEKLSLALVPRSNVLRNSLIV